MYTFSGIKLVKIGCSNFIFGTGNLHWCPVVPTKLQVRECIDCLNIRDLRCDVGATVYMYSDLILEIRAFLQSDPHEHSKSLP